MIKINNEWQSFLEQEEKKPYYKELRQFLINEYKTRTIYPPMDEIFNAFKITSVSDIKVVILGQDCYYREGQAMGLAFSVRNDVKTPPSLVNIFREISQDCGTEIDLYNSDLTRWAKQGVFLLNTILTVREGEPLSHSKHGWEIFTDNVIKYLDSDNRPKVFMLWGNNAKKKKSLILNSNHLVLEAGHPSPLSVRYFYGCHHFSQANEFLRSNHLDEIQW